jgi:hypothetical protein
MLYLVVVLVLDLALNPIPYSVHVLCAGPKVQEALPEPRWVGRAVPCPPSSTHSVRHGHRRAGTARPIITGSYTLDAPDAQLPEWRLWPLPFWCYAIPARI